MLQKYIPNTVLSCINYATRCDDYVIRPDAVRFGFHSNNEIKIKNGMKIYCWSLAVKNLFELIEQTNFKDIILISGDDDASANPNGNTVHHQDLNKIYAIPKLMPSNIKKWYAQNAEIVNNVMKPMPIGLCPPWGNGVSDASQLSNIIMDVSRTKLVYSNFTYSTNIWLRPQIFNTIIKNLGDKCTVQEYKNSKESMYYYYKNIQEHHYVICPPGNGVDTHRVWESLYLGAIPIVEDSPMNRYFARFFPILVVERWCDITEKFLKNKLEYFNKKEWRYDMLDCDNLFKEYGLQ